MFEGRVSCSRERDGHTIASGFRFGSLEEFIQKLCAAAQSAGALSQLCNATVSIHVNPSEKAEDAGEYSDD